MTSTEPKVITRRQAKQQISYFSVPLFFYILLNMILRECSGLLYRYYPQLFFGFDVWTATLTAGILLALIFRYLVFPGVSKRLHLNIRDYMKMPKLAGIQWLSIICLGIGITLIAVSFSSLFYFMSSSTSTYDFLGSFNGKTNIINNILYFILFVCIRPHCDEYIFRGTIQRQLGHYGRYFGVLGSAVLYALAQPDMMRAVSGFFVGWYLALATLKYHSIRPGFRINFALSLFLWILNVVPGNLFFIPLIMIVFVYVICAFSIFSKKAKTNIVRYGATEWKLWKILLTTPGVILCIITFIINCVLTIIL